jgi:hypothetical protein
MDIEETFHPKEIESLLSNLWDTMKNVPTERWQMPRTTSFQRLVDIRGWRSIIQEQINSNASNRTKSPDIRATLPIHTEAS